MLRGEPGSALHRRLRDAAFDEDSFCAVAGLCPAPRRFRQHPECEVGDALTMTPPLTGNGMSMAFESSEVAVEPLVRYSQGECGWDRAQALIAAGCHRLFWSRLLTATLLQAALFHPVGARLLGCLVSRFPQTVQMLFRWTR